MGNTIGGATSGSSSSSSIRGRKKTKVMKLSGESFKLKTPVSAMDVVKDYPGHVLLESMSVKRFGIRAKPLELKDELKPNKLYFLVELPKKIMQTPASRGVHGSNTSAADRLEGLMISRRSCMKKQSLSSSSSNLQQQQQVKVKLLRSQLEKITEDCIDGADLAHKVLQLSSSHQTTKFSCKHI